MGLDWEMLDVSDYKIFQSLRATVRTAEKTVSCGENVKIIAGNSFLAAPCYDYLYSLRRLS